MIEPHDALLAALHRVGLDTVAGAFAYTGGEPLPKKGLRSRERFRLNITDDAGVPRQLYLKRYGPLPLAARFAQGRHLSRARAEFNNICAVRRAGVPTMREVTFGEEMGAWGERRSYVLFETVPGEALSRCGEAFFDRHGGDAAVMDAFNRELLTVVCSLHKAGLVHRDLYAAHLFLDMEQTLPRLYLIDLARVFKPRWRLMRWQVKDLSAIRFSMPRAWTEKWWDHFLYHWIETVCGMTRSMGCWSRAVSRRVARMTRRLARK